MERPSWWTRHSWVGALALLAWGLAPAWLAPGGTLRIRETLRNDRPSLADFERMEHGYYEQILDAGRTADALDVATTEPSNAAHERLTTRVGDVREYVLKPNMTHDPGRRIFWTTNSQGMRDREYAVKKPRGTFRIALVGDSIAAGWGVGDEKGFEPRLEASLKKLSGESGGPRVEVLNFAVPGHGPGQRWTHFATVGWAFEPDLVIFEATPADAGWDERRLRGLLTRGVGFDAPVYREVLAKAGVRPGLPAAAYRGALKPLRDEVLAGVYREAAAECRSRGVPVVMVLIPRVGKASTSTERGAILGMARAAGFAGVVDVSRVYEGAAAESLAVGPDDFHPNAAGHARIAAALTSRLAALPALARLTGREDDGTLEGAETP